MKKKPTIEEFAERAKCDDYIAVAFWYYMFFLPSNVSLDEFFKK